MVVAPVARGQARRRRGVRTGRQARRVLGALAAAVAIAPAAVTVAWRRSNQVAQGLQRWLMRDRRTWGLWSQVRPPVGSNAYRFSF